MNYGDTIKACSIQALREDRANIRARKKQQREDYVNDTAEAASRSLSPVIEELKAMVLKLEEQNTILQKQVEDANEAAKSAEKEAKRAVAYSWISFGVATLLSIAAIVISIFAL